MAEMKTIAVEYSKPKLKQRGWAVVIDGLCLILSTLMFSSLLYIGTIHLPFYTEAQETLTQIKLDSGLYVESDGKLELISDHYADDENLSNGEAAEIFSDALDGFFASEQFFAPGAGTKFLNSQKAQELSLFHSVEGKESTDPGQYVPYDTADPAALREFYEDCCEKSIGFLSNDPEYSSSSKVITWSSIGTACIGYLISYLLLFLMVPMICRRGYKTLGMLAMRYGRVYVDGLNPTTERFLLRFGVAFLLEGVGFLALLIPLAFSATMTISGRYSQSLPDFLTNLYPVDTSETSIYFTPREYANALASGKTIGEQAKTPEQQEDSRRFGKGE